jgi:hypothetical protein
MTRILTLTALCALAASPTLAGGWETGKLDSSFLYEDGNYVELSYGSLDYAIQGTIQTGTKAKMAKDQTRKSLSGKFTVGNIDVGITSFDSGAIQMQGQASAANRGLCANSLSAPGSATTTNCSIVASADVNLDTLALLAKYKVNENFSAIAGMRRVNVQAATVQTVKTDYALDPVNKTGMIYGAAYEMPDIALKFEVLRSEEIKMGLTGSANGLMATAFGDPAFDSSSQMKVPEATTIKFQTGIAEGTLLMASAHKVKWASSQIDVKFAGAASALDVASEFVNTTAYSIGLGRKFAENTSGSLSYSWEKGGGATSGSGFTMSNGSKTLSLGLKHQTDNLTLSGGVSYTKVGDVNVSALGGLVTAAYADNSVTAVGLKASFDF